MRIETHRSPTGKNAIDSYNLLKSKIMLEKLNKLQKFMLNNEITYVRESK